MDLYSIILGILGLIITVLLALIPHFRKVYFTGPELTIQLMPDGGISMNRGLSVKNDTSQGFIDGQNAIYIFEVTWKVNIKIINNSEVTAYYPKISFLDQQLGFSKLDNLDENSPIKGNEQVILKGIYIKYEEVNGKQRTDPSGLPPNFKDLKILLEYKNTYKKKFYTVYSNSVEGEKNNYKRKKPREFNSI
jgi:hypothetical protein